MKQKFLFKTMLLLCALVAGSGSVWADEVVHYTLDGTVTATGNAYATATTLTQDGIGWSVVGNTEMNPWRIGGKGLTNVDRKIESTTAMGSAITKVEVSVGDTGSGLTVNSITLVVASDASFNTVLDEITKTSNLTLTTLTFTPTSGTEWATGAYYKIVFNVTRTSNSGNGYVQFNNAKFYKESGSSDPVPLEAPELTATAGNGSVTLEWDKISNASSYNIQYADNASFTGATTVANATSPKEISGLTNGTTYYFKAMTVGDETNYLSSDYGDAVSATPANVSKITITQNDLTSFTNRYDWYEWTAGGVSGKAYAYKNGGMQFNSGKDGYWIYNTSAIPGTITSVKMVKASGTADRSWTLKAGTSEISTTNGGIQIGTAQTVGESGATWAVDGSYKYFCLIVSGGSTVISSIEITYIPSTDPAISASDVDITYDATSGSIDYTLENATGNVTAAVTTGDWLTLGTITSSAVSFTCSANTGAERTATVTLSFSGADDKVVTVTQKGNPNYVPTISEVRAQGTGSVHTVGVVTSVNGKTAYIQDSGAAIAVYNSSANLSVSVGDEIDVTGTLGTYNGLLQIQSPTISVLSNSNSVTPEVMTIAQVNASTKQGWLVKIEDATVSTISDLNVTIAQSSNTIVVRFNDASDITFAANNVITLTGNIGNYNAVQIANPTDVSVATNTTSVITITASDPVNVSAAAGSGDFALSYENLTISDANDFAVQFYDENDDELDSQNEPDWIAVYVEAADPSGYKVSYLVGENNGAARSAYFKVWAYDDELNEVYSDLITITQAANVPTTTYTLATSVTPGKTYVIASGTSGDVKVMSILQNTNNRSTVKGSVSETTLSVQPNMGAAEMIVYGPDASGNYTIYNARYKDDKSNWVDGGYLYAGGSGSSKNYLKTQTTNDANGKWSISIDGETKAATVVAQGSNTNKYLRFNSTLFSCYSSTSSIKNPVYLYEKADAAVATTASVTLNSYGYATYATTNALDFLDADAENVGYSAWQITDANSSTGVITFGQIKETVAAGKGILLKGTPGATVNLNILPVGGATLYSNILVGTTETVHLSTAGEAYGLLGNKFVKNSGAGDIPANKAYIPATSIPSSVKAFTFVFDDVDDPTSIQTIDNGQQTTDDAIYNVAGQRLNKMQKGINIVNGKKVLY